MLDLTGIDPETLQTENIKNKKDIYATGIIYRFNNKDLAELTIINPDIALRFDIRNDIFYAEVNWSNLIEIVRNHQIRYRDLPKYPEVRRDLSLLLDKAVTYNQIKDLAFRTEKQILRRIQLFDVFGGEKIEPGKKSYAVSFILQDIEKTLTDDRIDRIMKKLMDAYVRELGAVIR